MTIRNGNHCYAYRCACGAVRSGYGSETAAARAERHHRACAPTTHVQPRQEAAR